MPFLGTVKNRFYRREKMMARKLDERRVIIEFLPSGSYVKVSAFDPVSMVEVSIVGNPASGEAGLKQVVLRKLKYVLEKKSQPEPRGPGHYRLITEINGLK